MPIQLSKIPILLGVMVSLHTTLIAKTTSGLRYATQPVVTATDQYGNIDMDYMNRVTLSSNGSGALGGTLTQPAIKGVVHYKDINYTSNEDNESYTLTASDGNLTHAISTSILSEMVATEVPITPPTSHNIIVPVKEGEQQWDTTAKFDDTIEVAMDETDGIKTATFTIDEQTIKIAVANSGTMQGSVAFSDKNGNPVTSSMQILATRSETTVDTQGNIETTVQTANNSTVKMTISKDRTVKHEVQTAQGLTVAISAIAGSDVEINANGDITTTSTVEKDGFIYKAVVSTNTQGETSTKFVKINIATNEQINLSHTLKEGGSFALGNESDVFEMNNMIYIKIIAPLNEALEIE